MATLTLSRTDQFANRFRAYKININGQEQVHLRNNENKSITLGAGTYTICATIDWLGSREFEITLGEHDHTTLEVGCNIAFTTFQKLLNILGIVILFGSITLYATVTPLAWALLLGIWLLRYMVFSKQKSFLYYLTKGRSSYLYISNLSKPVLH